MAFCTNCGFSTPEGSEFCPNCGTKVNAPAGGPQAAPQQQYYAPQAPSLVSVVLKKSIAFVMAKPIRLWGISLLNTLLIALAVLTTMGFPLVGLAIGWVLQMGMTIVFLYGYRGNEVSCDQLFAGFKNFFRSAGGMGWRELWILIWSMIPIVGPIFAIIKGYSYAFVPYILVMEPETTATEALRKSMAMTQGYKLKMWLADLIVGVAIFVVVLVLGLLALIPFIGILFTIILVLVGIVIALVLPLLTGTIQAAFYEEIVGSKK